MSNLKSITIAGYNLKSCPIFITSEFQNTVQLYSILNVFQQLWKCKCIFSVNVLLCNQTKSLSLNRLSRLLATLVDTTACDEEIQEGRQPQRWKHFPYPFCISQCTHSLLPNPIPIFKRKKSFKIGMLTLELTMKNNKAKPGSIHAVRFTEKEELFWLSFLWHKSNIQI